MMTLRIAAAAGLAAGLLAGCSMTPPNKPDPVEVSGTVTLPGGQPAPAGLVLNFFPSTADQTQVPATLKAGGKFTAKVVPGKYIVGFEGAGVKAVPAKYHSPDAANTIEVPPGGTSDLTIALDK
jgi:hypothetical protein